MALPIDVVIMAAGKGTRMKSTLPKVLHRLGGRALLGHVIDCAARLSARQAVVITGHGATEVEAACARMTGAQGDLSLKFARQMPQLGTGHAVQQALPLLQDDGVTLVLSGDVPLTQADTLAALLGQCDGQRLPDGWQHGDSERAVAFCDLSFTERRYTRAHLVRSHHQSCFSVGGAFLPVWWKWAI